MTLGRADEAWFHAELDRAGVPGAALAWVTRSGASGQLEHGFADLAAKKPVEAATRFHLFSGTKLYTATAVMRLVERGALELDAPVRRYLPELPVRDELTVTHLLSHASGLPDTLRAFLSVQLAGDPVPSTAEALARYQLGRGRAPGRPRAVRQRELRGPRRAGLACLGRAVRRRGGSADEPQPLGGPEPRRAAHRISERVREQLV